MTAHLNGPSGPIPLEKKDLILGKEKSNGHIDVLPPTSVSSNQYVKICVRSSTQPMYSITDISNSPSGILLNDEKLTPNTPYWLNPDDEIRISQTLYFYRENAAGARLEGVTLASHIPLKSPALTLGKAIQTNGHIHMKNDTGAADKHASIRPHPPGQVYGVIDLGNTREGTMVNYKPFKNNQQKPYWLNPGDKLLIGRTGVDEGAVFTYEETSSSPDKSSSSIGVFIFGLIVGFLAALSLVWLSNGAFQSQSTPDQTLASFCDALNKANYRTAYDQLSKNAQKQMTEQQFASALQQTFTRQGGLKDCTTGNIQTNDTTASGMLTMTFQNRKTASYSISLVKEGDVWKIDALKPKLTLQVPLPYRIRFVRVVLDSKIG
jgi:hypothetical protein